jgi:hypothetical protein
MKFVTMGSYKEVFHTLPKQEQLELIRGDLEFWIKMKTKMGNRISYYGMPGWNRAMSIGDFENIEEFNLSLQNPTSIAGLVNVESYPLIESDLKILKTSLKQMKAAK